jgi:hypothetical protein
MSIYSSGFSGRAVAHQEVNMAVGIVFDGIGVSQAQYEQVLHQVSPDNSLAPGELHHIAGTTEGGIVVVELWESSDAMMAFFNREA